MTEVAHVTLGDDDHARLVNPYSWLDKAELERYQHFTTYSDSRLFLLSRVVLKARVATVCDCRTHQVEIRSRESGQPYLVSQPLYVSLAHTRSSVAVAISDSAEVGVDLERTNRVLREPNLLGPLILSKRERDWVSAAGTTKARVHRLLMATVQKEARYKLPTIGSSVLLPDIAIYLEEFPFEREDTVAWRTELVDGCFICVTSVAPLEDVTIVFNNELDYLQ